MSLLWDSSASRKAGQSPDSFVRNVSQFHFRYVAANSNPMRLRFTIRDLFWLVVVVAVIAAIAVRYIQLEHRFADETIRYGAAVARHEAGLSLTVELCAESFILYLAERDRWFHGGDALRHHLDRLQQLEQLAESKIDDPHASEKAANIRALRESFKKEAF